MWLDKNSWPLEQWLNQVEILYFGLAKPFIGLKLSGALLSEAVRSAWDWQNEAGEAPERVWVNTCSDDHPSALAN